jgi:hypothetical protein
MKFEKILACAVGAGLLTLGAGSARALVIDDDLVPVLNAALIVKITEDNGKTKSVSVTSKDLLIAVGEDLESDSSFYKGDEIGLVDNNDYWILTPKGEELVDLSVDGVIEYEQETLTESEHEGGHGSFTDSQTGDFAFIFASDEDTIDPTDNEIFIEQEGAPYTYTVTGAAVTHGDKQAITVTEKGGVSTEGWDFDVFDNGDDPVPIFGTVTLDASGTIVE